MKKLILFSLLLTSSIYARALTLTWDANEPADEVSIYLVEYRAGPADAWVQIPVPGTQTRVELPDDLRGHWFRIAAKNEFGTSAFTKPVKIPGGVKGLKAQLFIEIEP